MYIWSKKNTAIGTLSHNLTRPILEFLNDVIQNPGCL